MTAPLDTAPFEITNDPITWECKIVVIDDPNLPHKPSARYSAKIVDADQWTVLATWRPGGLPDLLSHGVFERATGYGREIRGARLYNMAPATATAKETILTAGLMKITEWVGYKTRLSRMSDDELSEEALEARHYERGANDMLETVAAFAREALAEAEKH